MWRFLLCNVSFILYTASSPNPLVDCVDKLTDILCFCQWFIAFSSISPQKKIDCAPACDRQADGQRAQLIPR